MQQRGVHLCWASIHQGKEHCGHYSLTQVVLHSIEAGISSAVQVSDSVGLSMNLPLHFLYPPMDLNIGRKQFIILNKADTCI